MTDAARSGTGGARPHGADAVLVEDGSIVAIGRRLSLASDGIEIVDHEAGVIAPVLHDHHFHPVGYASAVSGLSLKNAVDHADLLSKLRDAADRLGPNEALVGNRLDEEGMTERRLPTRFDLDPAVPERPTLLYRYCGHVAVANTAALRLAGSRMATGSSARRRSNQSRKPSPVFNRPSSRRR